jgi:hypothetical protein
VPWLIFDVGPSNDVLIREHSSGKARKPMPTWARLVAGMLGLLLLVAGVSALLIYRPLELRTGVAAVSAAGLGLDLIIGTCSSKWPLALQWMPFI